MDEHQRLFNLFSQNQCLSFKWRGDVDQVDFYLTKRFFLDGIRWDRDIQRAFGHAFRLKGLPERINLHNFLVGFIRDWLPGLIQVFEGNRLDIQDIIRFVVILILPLRLGVSTISLEAVFTVMTTLRS